MKRLIFLIAIVFPHILFSQALNENPYLAFYLGPNLLQGSLGSLTTQNYDGITKVELAKNLPSSWISKYSQNNLPCSDRYAPANAPFGRNYILVSTPRGISLATLSSHLGEWDSSIGLKYPLSRNIKTAFSLNYHHYDKILDKNADNFSDLAKKKKLFGLNSWSWENNGHSIIINAFHLNSIFEKGAINFNKETDYLTTNAYGLGGTTKHSGVALKSDFVIKDENQKTKSVISLDTDIRISNNKKHFGLNEYAGKENISHLYAGYQSTFRFTDYELGIHYKYDKTEEDFSNTNWTNRKENNIGIYGKVETYIFHKLKFMSDLRVNYSSLEKLQLNPSFKLDYTVNQNISFGLFSGSGYRRTHIISDFEKFLFSGRQINAGSLPLEEACHYGASIKLKNSKSIKINNYRINGIQYHFLFYHNIYQQLNEIDLTQPGEIHFIHHRGKAYKLSLNNRLQIIPFRNMSLTAMHRFDIFKTDISGQMKNRFYHPKNSFLFAYDYNIRYIKFNTQFQRTSPAPSPETAYGNGSAPAKNRWDASITYRLKNNIKKLFFLRKLDITIGLDNILGEKENSPIINSNAPFSNEMDGGLRNNHLVGRRFYVGLRLDF